MKVWCDIDEEYVTLKENAAAFGEIWECDSEFFLIASRPTRYSDSCWKYKIRPLYPVIIRSEECKVRENRVFTFVCSADKLEDFLSQRYIIATLKYGIEDDLNSRRN